MKTAGLLVESKLADMAAPAATASGDTPVPALTAATGLVPSSVVLPAAFGVIPLPPCTPPARGEVPKADAPPFRTASESAIAAVAAAFGLAAIKLSDARGVVPPTCGVGVAM